MYILYSRTGHHEISTFDDRMRAQVCCSANLQCHNQDAKGVTQVITASLALLRKQCAPLLGNGKPERDHFHGAPIWRLSLKRVIVPSLKQNIWCQMPCREPIGKVKCQIQM